MPSIGGTSPEGWHVLITIAGLNAVFDLSFLSFIGLSGVMTMKAACIGNVGLQQCSAGQNLCHKIQHANRKLTIPGPQTRNGAVMPGQARSSSENGTLKETRPGRETAWPSDGAVIESDSTCRKA
ncbi:hypothetical protein EW146_g8114 [Bondarzewia mesenterica]|uniref:Uncharacterized protein n=1 Tax=Bondarzewia mesenterica TaxID=1095465 RepID=A0A4S4LGZ2_9AGAM|nr:hypothetical protein EW146_g8114 [Bondarzewia mesenterica]